MDFGEYRLYSSLPCLESAQKLARIDLGALRKNYRALCELLGKRRHGLRNICVVKADAYGHGARECVRVLLEEGCDFFAVSCIEEALAVREVCDAEGSRADILILGYSDPETASLLSAANLTQTLLSKEYADALHAAAEKAGVRLLTHVAVNTGMNRIGFDARSEEEICLAAKEIEELGALPCFKLCGMFTHFACADGDGFDGVDVTRTQETRYESLRLLLEERGVMIPFHHVCNSAAAIKGETEIYHGARLGILLYGVCPALHLGVNLTPVMRLEARILHTHKLLSGERVGYGGDFCAESERRIAVIGIGYADGWLRAYSGARVLVKAKSGASYYVPIVGRICMDQCMLDVTGTDVCVGDAAVLFGDGAQQLEELSRQVGSIDYEGLCLISARVLRAYTDVTG